MALDLAHRLLAIRFNLTHVPVPLIPEFIDMLKLLYTREEARLAALMPPTFASARTIAKLQRGDSTPPSHPGRTCSWSNQRKESLPWIRSDFRS